MGFAGDVPEDRRPLREDRGHERVLRRGDGGLIEEDIGALEAARAELIVVTDADPSPEPLERVEMGVEAPTTDHVAPGGREADVTDPAQERPREEDRGADPLAELRVKAAGVDLSSADLHLVTTEPLDLSPPIEMIAWQSTSTSRIRGTFV